MIDIGCVFVSTDGIISHFLQSNRPAMKFRVFVIGSLLTLLMILGSMILGSATAQMECTSYKLVPRITFDSQPVQYSQYVDETVMETRKLTTYKPVWTRETRQRVSYVLKPVTTTSQREERFLVRRPIVETNYIEQQVRETSYETVTEMKEQRWLVEKPVVETQYREQDYLVRKPVTRTYMETENLTSYQPVTIRETGYVPGATVTDQLVLSTGRNRLRWLRPGTYVDPVNGSAQFKRAGLHWVPDQQLELQSRVSPTWHLQQVERTAYRPETVRVRRPVQTTEYVDQVETRRVPVNVTKTSREIMVTRTPVQVRKPVVNVTTQQVPVREVKYREEVLVRRVPVTETKYQRVERVEPYEVEVCKWVAETKDVVVPRVVRRRVDYTMNQAVPRQSWMRVPVDAWGNVAGTIESSGQTSRQTVYRYPVSERLRSAPVMPAQLLTDAEYEHWLVRNNLQREQTETSRRVASGQPRAADSVLVPTADDLTDVNNPASDTVEVRRPNLAGPTPSNEADSKATSDSGSESNQSDGVQLNDPGAPDMEDRQTESSIDIESSESSDVDGREEDI